MPLKQGTTKEVIEETIKTLMKSGKRTQEESAVIAARVAAGPKK